MLGCCADLCAEDSGKTALHVAISSFFDPVTFESILEILLSTECNIDAVMDHSWTSSDTTHLYETALYQAINENMSDIAIILLQHGADPNSECPHDLTILHKACHRLDLRVIDLLLVHGGIDWTRETWLDTTQYTCGVNRNLMLAQLDNYADDVSDHVPPILSKHVDIYFMLMEVRSTVPRLLQLCRIAIRTAMASQLYIKVGRLGLPPSLRNYIMMKEE